MKTIENNRREEESKDYKEFKHWCKYVTGMLHTFNVEQLIGLRVSLIDITKGINISNSVKELKGLVRVKKMIIKIDRLLSTKGTFNY